jgi:hypothetical protein
LYLQFGADRSSKKKIKLLLSINLSKYQPFKESMYLPFFTLEAFRFFPIKEKKLAKQKKNIIKL